MIEEWRRMWERREVTLREVPGYVIWYGMVQRCHNPKRHDYHYYGGRGIKVWQPWRNDFWAWLKHVGIRPSPAHSFDRWPDNDGNYEPGNWRWATAAEQLANRRDPYARIRELEAELKRRTA